MIDPQYAVFLYDPAKEGKRGFLFVGDARSGLERHKILECSLGASCSPGWASMSDDEIYQCMHWLALEIAEFAGVSIRNIRDMMAENVHGYRAYESKISAMALGRIKTGAQK